MPRPLRRRGLAALLTACALPVAALAGPQEGGKTEPAKTEPAKTETAKTVEVAAGDLTLTVPEAWRKQPPANRMRLAEFQIPPAEGAEGETVVTVFGGFGGTDEANLTRWANQFAPEGREVSVVRGEGREGEYKLLDAAGTWNAPVGPPMMGKTAPAPGSRMLAAIVAVEGGGNYFLKMTGPKATVDAQAAAFRASFGANKESEKPFALK